ncbi:MAG: hypothetical protein Q9214_005581, partial [Letrouitia sp. 1 TL-2023]
MTSPPAKRQKHLTFRHSKEEDITPRRQVHGDKHEQNNQTSKKAHLPKLINKPSQGSSAPIPQSSHLSNSPKYTSGTNTQSQKHARKLYPLESFFNAAKETQPAPSSQSSTKAGQSQKEIEGDDLIEDDSLEEGIPGGDRHNSPLDHSIESVTKSHDQQQKGFLDTLPPGSQKFLSAGRQRAGAKREQAPPLIPRTKDTRPWAERYGPTNREELMVHNKKVADIEQWLCLAFKGHSDQPYQRLLVLKGPSGAGKTATVSTLARSMDFDIVEWSNPVVSDLPSRISPSVSSQFEDFVRCASKFNALELSGSEETPMPASPRPKVMLLEEFPNSLMAYSSALQSFRSSVLQHLARHGSKPDSKHLQSSNLMKPCIQMIMIVTETVASSTTYMGDSFTAHRLLGPEILEHPRTSIISFNPIATTYLTKALGLVIQKEARDSGRRRVPGPLVLQKLSEAGDVRSAIESLEFLCLRRKDCDNWGGRVASSRRNQRSQSMPGITDMEKESLQLVTQREVNLDLFHAVGKVVYNRREEVAETRSSTILPVQPPDHLPQHFRLKPSEVSLQGLLEDVGADTQTFCAALHENYVLSCHCRDFTESLNGCIDALSDSDFLLSNAGRARGSVWNGGLSQGAATGSLRQDQISLELAVRGLLFSLPHPVRRPAHPGLAGRTGSKLDAFKMFYPASMRLSKQIDEAQGLLRRWVQWRRAADAFLHTDQREGAAPWSQGPTTSSSSPSSGIYPPGTAERGPEEVDGRGSVRTSAANEEALLDTLPYLAVIKSSSSPPFMKELQRITRFGGHSAANQEAACEDDALLGSGEHAARCRSAS